MKERHMGNAESGFVQLNEKICITHIYCQENIIITFNIYFGSGNC